MVETDPATFLARALTGALCSCTFLNLLGRKQRSSDICGCLPRFRTFKFGALSAHEFRHATLFTAPRAAACRGELWVSPPTRFMWDRSLIPPPALLLRRSTRLLH